MTGRVYGQIDGALTLDALAARLAGDGMRVTLGRYAVRLSGARFRCKLAPTEDGFLLADGVDGADPTADARALSRWLALKGLRHRLEVHDDDGALLHYFHHAWPLAADHEPSHGA